MLGVTIHDDMWAAASLLPADQRRALLEALLAYGFDGVEPGGDAPWLPIYVVCKDRVRMSSEKSLAGKALAAQRWNKKPQVDAHAMRMGPTHDAEGSPPYDAKDAPSHDAEERRGEVSRGESKSIVGQGDEGAEERRAIVAHLNEACGTHYRASTPKTRKLIATRMREGFTVDDFKRVIDNKAAQWLGDPSMRRYLRPETLFGTKFEGYLNETAAGGGRVDHSDYDF